ncbi:MULTISPECIES: hypothetical protein [Gordonia]|uniref:hypothetical protein n=1 Tax=Gordonia TaxID=2053 RepID=UPI001331A289|nr:MULTISPECIES: hypothetical protein [Gordonia]KAF0970302.1 hypothetical protein BPODLACK_01355 [Gordonia sp. YY1]UPW15774.1 hypothetical protein M0655_09725 [Gordonia amicalis]
MSRRLLVRVARGYGRFLGVVLSLAHRAGGQRLPAGPGPTAGVLVTVHVALVTIWFGPLGLALAVMAGLGAGVVAGLRIRHRPLSDEERRAAERVFGPAEWFDDVILTDLSGLGGRAFTLPAVDGLVFCHLGAMFDAPLGPGPVAYPVPGQLLIHELVHVRQIVGAGSSASFLADALAVQARHELGENVYRLRGPGDAHHEWAEHNLERQATIVDRWYGGQSSPSRRPMDPDSPFAPLIAQVRAPIPARGNGRPDRAGRSLDAPGPGV